MTSIFTKIYQTITSLLLLTFVLTPTQSSAASVLDPVAIERDRCISFYNSANYFEAATCFGNLFNNSLNTARSKELNNKTVSLRAYNNFCIEKFNRADFAGAAACFSLAIPLACSSSPIIEDYCTKFTNNRDVSNRQNTFNTNNLVLINQQRNELNRCNNIYYSNDLNGALDCYNTGIKNTCFVFNGTDNLLDELCGKFRNNSNTVQNEISDCYNYYNNYNSYDYYNSNYYYNNYNYSAKCSKIVNNTSDTAKIIAGVATVGVLACVFFCNSGSSSSTNSGGSSTAGTGTYYYNGSGGGSSESGSAGGGTGQSGY